MRAIAAIARAHHDSAPPNPLSQIDLWKRVLLAGTALSMLTLLLSACNYPATATVNAVPHATTAPTSTLGPSPAPLTATVIAFQSDLANLCPTQSPWTGSFDDPISDADIISQFVGRYSYNNGAEIVNLLIDCTLTYQLRIDWYAGSQEYSDGTWRLADHQLELLSKNANDWHLLPVRWGLRRYLIEPERLKQFCASVADPDILSEPRRQGWGEFFLRRHDDELPGIGVPVMPSGEATCK